MAINAAANFFYRLVSSPTEINELFFASLFLRKYHCLTQTFVSEQRF